ncbi:hypothetical protein HKX48_001580, partial [Thoreauomyces humboldtii]
ASQQSLGSPPSGLDLRTPVDLHPQDHTPFSFDFGVQDGASFGYPTPADSPFGTFDTDNLSPALGQTYPEFDSLLADLYDCPLVTTPNTTLAASPQPDHLNGDSFDSLFGDLPFYDVDAYPIDSNLVLFPDLADLAPLDAVNPVDSSLSLFPDLADLASLDTVSPDLVQTATDLPTVDGSVTLSYSQLASLLAAAAEGSKSNIAANGSDDGNTDAVLTTKKAPRRSIKDTSTRRGDQKFVCPHPGCGKEFTRYFNLKSHLPLHDPSRPRPFPCTACDKSFFKENDLIRHVHTHTQENECECACGKRYSRVDALKRHVKRHGCVELP